TYTGTVEPFLSGVPLPVTDLVIHPADGALYFTVGGRGAPSAVYRVTYEGKDSTAPVVRAPDGLARAREERRALEKLHDGERAELPAAAWLSLGHAERSSRYAARVALEHQPVERWKDRALAETDPVLAIPALIALARCGDKAVQPELV